MDIVLQKTLKTSVTCRGVALHHGGDVTMTMRPAAPDTGVVFRRIDLGRGAEIEASWRHATESPLCSVLRRGAGLSVSTIEHLMAALAGLEIDNVVVELDGPEVPVMDGSAGPFVQLIEEAGIVEQRDAPRRYLKILNRVVVTDGAKRAEIAPDLDFTVEFEIDFAGARAIGQQAISIALDVWSFKAELSRARTFGLLQEVDAMRAQGLARGGSLENAVVVDGDRVLNDGGLRYADEFVRHKALDAVGDLYLAGGPMLGRFRGVRSSHAINRRLLAKLFSSPSAWCWTTKTRNEADGWFDRAASAGRRAGLRLRA